MARHPGRAGGHPTLAAGFDRSDWRISPLYGDLSVLPKTLLFTGTRDILHPDSLVFAERARAVGVDIEIVVEPGMLHVWPLMGIPEARPARDRIVAFLRDERTAEPVRNELSMTSLFAWTYGRSANRNFGIEQDWLAHIIDRRDCHRPINAKIPELCAARTLKARPRAGSQRHLRHARCLQAAGT